MDRYDYVGTFNQGVAIVVRNGLYGCILVGGKEIIPPSYEYISSFKDGYAQAIRKGECFVLDLSGRVGKFCNGKFVAIPSKYDRVKDFKDGLALVQRDGKWGAIDSECTEIFEPKFYYLSDFCSGVAKYQTEQSVQKNLWGYVCDNGFISPCNLNEPIIESDGSLIVAREEIAYFEGQLQNKHIYKVRINYKGKLLIGNKEKWIELPDNIRIIRNFKNGFACIQDKGGEWGLINLKGQIVIPLLYASIQEVSESKTFCRNKAGNLCLVRVDGQLVKEFDEYTDAQPFKNGYAVISEKNKNGIITSDGAEVLHPIEGFIHSTKINDEFLITTSRFGGKKGFYKASTGLLIRPQYNDILGVYDDYAIVEVEDVGRCFVDFAGRLFINDGSNRIYLPEWCLGVRKISESAYSVMSDKMKWGLMDANGNTILEPKFDAISYIDNNLFSLEQKKTVEVGIWNSWKKEIVNYGLFNKDDQLCFLPIYDTCPKYVDGNFIISLDEHFGVLNKKGDIVIKPNWKSIDSLNGYYIVHNNYYCGLYDLEGNVLLDCEYKDVIFLNKGIFKIKENKTWSFYVAEDRIIKGCYDDINLDGEYFFVYKNGLKSRVNVDGVQFIKTDNDCYLQLPTKFSWGSDFENGIAKVLINGFENFIDSSFNIIVVVEDRFVPFGDIVDYIVKKDIFNNYIFSSKELVGVINTSGKILLEPIYQYIGNVTDKRCALGIIVAYRNEHFELFDDKYNVIAEVYSEFRGEIHDVQIENLSNIFFHLTINNNYSILLNQKFVNIAEFDCDIIAKAQFDRDLKLIPNVCAVSSNHASIYNSFNAAANELLPSKSKYSGISKNAPGLLWIYSDGKKIAKVNNGHWYEYEYYDPDFSTQKERTWSEGLWGLINEEGDFVLPIAFNSIQVLNDGYFFVSKYISNHQIVQGVVNTNGDLLVKNRNGDYITASKRFDWQEDFSTDGFSRVYYKGKVGFVNEEFQLVSFPDSTEKSSCYVLPREFDWGDDLIRWNYYLGGHYEFVSFVIVEQKGNKGVLSTDGHLLVNTVYNQIQVLREPNFVLFVCAIYDEKRQKTVFSLIDAKGKELLDEPSEEITYLGHSLLSIKNENSQYKIVNYLGVKVSNILFDIVCTFGISSYSLKKNSWVHSNKIEGLRYAIVSVSGKIGIIDKEGYLIINPKFESIEILNNSRFLADGELYNFCGQRLLVKDNWVVIFPEGFEECELLTNGLIKVSKDGLFGCINQQGIIVIPIKYNSLLCACQDKLLIASIHDNFTSIIYRGVLDFYGNEIIPFSKQFDEIKIEGGLILFEQNNHWGAYNLFGGIICEAIYDHIEYITDALIKVGQNGIDYRTDYSTYCDEYSIIEWGLIDSRGKEILPMEYRKIDDKIVNNVIQIYLNDRVGLVDITGRLLLEPTYESIGEFVEGYAIVTKNSRKYVTVYGVINSNFQETIPCLFSELKYDKESGLFETNVGRKMPDGRTIYYGDGKEVIVDKKYYRCKEYNEWDGTFIFYEGCAIGVSIQNEHIRFGLINLKSEDVFPPIFEQLFLLDNGLYKFMLNAKYGLVNNRGNIILPNKYCLIGKFQDNIACVKLEIRSKNNEESDLYGFIDSQGNEVLTPSYNFIGKRNNGYSVVRKNKVWGIFNFEQQNVINIPEATYLGPCIDGRHRVNVGGDYDRFTHIIKGGLWGFVSSEGSFVIDPIYELVNQYQEGLAAVRLYRKWGFIDMEGRVVVPCEYESIESNYSYGTCSLIKQNKVYVFDNKGNLKDTYDNIEEEEDDDNDNYQYNDYYDDDDSPTYSKYGGYNGYSDQAIDEAFGGDPSLTWNCD